MTDHDYASDAQKDLARSAPARMNQTQQRPVELMKISSDFDSFDQIDPFTQMSSNPAGTKVHRCVQKVKKKGGGANPYAVCQASTGQTYKTGKKR